MISRRAVTSSSTQPFTFGTRKYRTIILHNGCPREDEPTTLIEQPSPSCAQASKRGAASGIPLPRGIPGATRIMSEDYAAGKIGKLSIKSTPRSPSWEGDFHVDR
jgi:hypothetical protein